MCFGTQWNGRIFNQNGRCGAKGESCTVTEFNLDTGSQFTPQVSSVGTLCLGTSGLFPVWIVIRHFEYPRVHAVHKHRSRRVRYRNVHQCQLWLYKCISTRGEYRFLRWTFTRTHTTGRQDLSGCGNDSPVRGCSAGDKSWTITFCP